MINNKPNFQSNNFEICKIMANILNLSEGEIADNIQLFQNIDHYIYNCLYYLSKIQTKETRINAVASLEFVCIKSINKPKELDVNNVL